MMTRRLKKQELSSWSSRSSAPVLTDNSRQVAIFLVYYKDESEVNPKR
jgi:hypothetical protein